MSGSAEHGECGADRMFVAWFQNVNELWLRVEKVCARTAFEGAFFARRGHQR
jgi:hypothetical protein